LSPAPNLSALQSRCLTGKSTIRASSPASKKIPLNAKAIELEIPAALVARADKLSMRTIVQ